MIKRNDSVYEAAIAEVRGQASLAQVDLLTENPNEWIESLQTCIDDISSQLVSRDIQFDEQTEDLDENEYLEQLEEFLAWKANASTFRRHVLVRLRSVKRRVGFVDPAAVIDAVADLYEVEYYADASDDEDEHADQLDYAISNLLMVYERDFLQ